ncbi:MAG: alkaline phosphatase family protein, partial [Nitrososphaerales archaeon]
MTVYLLGFDGASLNTIQESMKRTRLPNFEKLLRNGASSDLLSVYPYVTAPAWTTIFSGVNPGKHGIFEMFEIHEDKIVPSNMRGASVPFLWDYLSWAGKRSLVVGVPFIYPAPKVNGIFVTGRFAPRL